MNQEELQRFYNKISPEPNSGCWLWTASLSTRGYARLAINKKARPAHRLSYEHFVGPILSGLEINHKCEIPSCVNPDHLEAVTHLENIRYSVPYKWVRNRTHCYQGHELTENNVYFHARGYRGCKECRRLGRARRRKRKRLVQDV